MAAAPGTRNYEQTRRKLPLKSSFGDLIVDL